LVNFQIQPAALPGKSPSILEGLVQPYVLVLSELFWLPEQALGLGIWGRQNNHRDRPPGTFSTHKNKINTASNIVHWLYNLSIYR
jgi:hypothetical protein